MSDALEGFYYGGHVVSDRRALTSLCLLFDRLHLATPYDKGEQLPGVVGFKRASRVLAAKRGVGALAARAVLDMLVEMLRRERLFLIKLGGEGLIRRGVVVAHGELPGSDDGTRARLLSAPKAKLASIFRAGAASVAVATGLSLEPAPTAFVGSSPVLPVPATAVLLKDGNFLTRGMIDAIRVDLPWIALGGISGRDLSTARERMAKVLAPYRRAVVGLVGKVRAMLREGAGRESVSAEAERVSREEISPACDEVKAHLEAAKGAAFRKLRRSTGPPLVLAIRAVPPGELQGIVDGGVEIVGGLDELLGGRGAALNRVVNEGNLALELRAREPGRAVARPVVKRKRGEGRSAPDPEADPPSPGEAEAD